MNLALPKGHLQTGVLQRLAAAGYDFKFSSDRNYAPTCSVSSVTAKLFKVRAIPQLVALRQYDAGFCGLDLIKEADYELVEQVFDLGLNPVSIVVAVSKGAETLLSDPPQRPLLIATEYPRLADEWAQERKLAHITIQTYGSTEAYAPKDADVVFDNCETGRTIEANGLVIVDTLFKSTTYLVANKFALADKAMAAEIDTMVAKLKDAGASDG